MATLARPATAALSGPALRGRLRDSRPLESRRGAETELGRCAISAQPPATIRVTMIVMT
jgi:hypothetical protein